MSETNRFSNLVKKNATECKAQEEVRDILIMCQHLITTVHMKGVPTF